MIWCYVLHICPHALVTQKWWQNVSRNLSQWILVPLGGGRGGGSCVEGMVQGWIGQKKMTILVTISYFFAIIYKDLIRVMLPIYYGTLSLTFCQISGLKETFEKIIKHQTALKFEFLGACIWYHDWSEILAITSYYAYFPCNRDLCRAMLPIHLGTSSSTVC